MNAAAFSSHVTGSVAARDLGGRLRCYREAIAAGKPHARANCGRPPGATALLLDSATRPAAKGGQAREISDVPGVACCTTHRLRTEAGSLLLLLRACTPDSTANRRSGLTTGDRHHDPRIAVLEGTVAGQKKARSRCGHE